MDNHVKKLGNLMTNKHKRETKKTEDNTALL